MNRHGHLWANWKLILVPFPPLQKGKLSRFDLIDDRGWWQIIQLLDITFFATHDDLIRVRWVDIKLVYWGCFCKILDFRSVLRSHIENPDHPWIISSNEPVPVILELSNQPIIVKCHQLFWCWNVPELHIAIFVACEELILALVLLERDLGNFGWALLFLNHLHLLQIVNMEELLVDYINQILSPSYLIYLVLSKFSNPRFLLHCQLWLNFRELSEYLLIWFTVDSDNLDSRFICCDCYPTFVFGQRDVIDCSLEMECIFYCVHEFAYELI